MGASNGALQVGAGARQFVATRVDLFLLAGQLVLDFLPARIIGTMIVIGPARSRWTARCLGSNRVSV